MSTALVGTSARDHERNVRLLHLASATAAQLAACWTTLVAERNRVLALLDANSRRPRGRSRTATPAVRQALVLFAAAVATFNRNALAIVDKWVSVELSLAYRDGAVQALQRAGQNEALFTWTARHQAALAKITASAHAALALRVAETVRRGHAFARAARTASADPEGPRTAVLARTFPLGSVIYANAARHPAAAWAASALAAQIAAATNTGAINTARDELYAYLLEVIDGDDCGWVSHDDPDLANGSIRDIDDCGDYPIAHPGCVREFVPHAMAPIPGELS